METSPLSDEQFRDLVLSELREEVTEEIRTWLRSPEVLERWVGTLVGLIRDVMDQQTRNKAHIAEAREEHQNDRANWLAWQRDNENWRQRSSHFKRKVEDRLAEVKTLLKAENIRRHERVNHVEMSQAHARRLRWAIVHHRETRESEAHGITEADLELWREVE